MPRSLGISTYLVVQSAKLEVPSYFHFSNFYQIAHLGDDDGEPEFSSAIQLEEGETFFFAPRPLKNLVVVDELESLSPIMTAKVCSII